MFFLPRPHAGWSGIGVCLARLAQTRRPPPAPRTRRGVFRIPAPPDHLRCARARRHLRPPRHRPRLFQPRSMGAALLRYLRRRPAPQTPRRRPLLRTRPLADPLPRPVRASASCSATPAPPRRPSRSTWRSTRAAPTGSSRATQSPKLPPPRVRRPRHPRARRVPQLVHARTARPDAHGAGCPRRDLPLRHAARPRNAASPEPPGGVRAAQPPRRPRARRIRHPQRL